MQLYRASSTVHCQLYNCVHCIQISLYFVFFTFISEKSKEEISQEDLFGALSALNNSPGNVSPQSKAESSTSRESTQTVLLLLCIVIFLSGTSSFDACSFVLINSVNLYLSLIHI